MRKILFLLLVCCTFAMNAQVRQVSGNQVGTWSGEIHITEDVIVPKDQTLTIDAGTTVIADGYFGITVLGTLYALGEEDARISFTVADTTGYSDYEHPELGGWKGIDFQKSDDVKMSYCDVSYGKTPIDVDGGGIRINMVHYLEFSHCRFYHNTTRRRGGAVYAENSALNIHDCEVYDNFGFGSEGSYTWGIGFQFLKCDIGMHDMVFHDNNGPSAYGGGMNVDSCNLELRNAVFYNNYAVNAGGLGIQRCKNYTVKVANMLAYNNSVMHYGGGLAMATSDPELNNLTIVNNYCGGGGGAGMQMAFNAEPTLNNCIFWGNHALYYTNKDDRDTVDYYMGSQIWLWGDDCSPIFNNGVVQYGLDSINSYNHILPENYNDMLDVDPLFADEQNHDYKLLANSPCINTGLADLAGLFIPDTDLAGGMRVVGGRIDMGCYEYGNTGVNDVTVDENTMSVYPNPLNDNAFCVINLTKSSDVVLRLVSLDGKEIYREDCGRFDAGENRISLDGMMKNIGKSNKMYLLIVDNQCVKIIY